MFKRLKSHYHNPNALMKDGILVGGAQAITVVFGFITLILLGKGLTLEDFGHYQFFLAWVAACSIFSLPGYNIVLTKAVFDKEDSVFRHAVKHSVLSVCMASVPVILIVWLAQYYQLITNQPLELIGFIIVFSLLAPLEKYDSYLVAKRQFIYSRSIIIFQSTLNCLLVGGAAMIYATTTSVLLAALSVKLLTLSVAWFFTLKTYSTAEKTAVSNLNNYHLKQAVKYTAVSSTSILSAQIDRIILGLMDEKILAIYVMGSYFPKRVKDNFKVLSSVLTTYLGLKNNNDYLELLTRYKQRFLLGGYSLIFLLMLFSCLVIHFAFPEAGIQAIIVCIVLFLLMPFLFFCTFINAYDVHKTEGGFYRRLIVKRNIVYIACILPLSYYWSIYGIIIASVITDIYLIFNILKYFDKQTISTEQRQL